MKIHRKKTVTKQVEETVEKYVVCDKCGERINKTSSYDIFNCEFKYTTGEVFPEGGSEQVRTVDLCPTCAGGLVTLLKDNGYRVNEYERDI